MKRDIRDKLFFGGLLVGIFLCLALVCIILVPETRQSVETKDFRIDTTSILDDIAMRRSDIFILVDENAPDDNPASAAPVNWIFSDYYDVAQAFFSLVIEEPIENWHLNRMIFGLDCRHIDNGVQDATFTFFRNEIPFGEASSRIVERVSIIPQENLVDLSTEVYAPNRLFWPKVDLAEIEISLEDALRIAESSGGSETRLSVGNKCEILVALNPNLGRVAYDGWIVDYLDEENEYLAIYYVNPVTGEIEERRQFD